MKFNNNSEIKMCEKCQSLRPLRTHLYELSRIGELLSNANEYVDKEDTRLVKTQELSQWLKLASELDSVQIDTWKFAGEDGMWCRPAAEMYTSDSKHFSVYSTNLTRFIYIYNSLEELYKFLDKHYDVVPKKIRSPSVKCSYLLNNTKNIIIPNNFWHLSENYQSFIKQYAKTFCVTIKSDTNFNNKVSFALDLIRDVRNHIAHGVFPIADNPEYSGFGNNEMRLISNLLGHSCRLAALYIQMIFLNFNNGFSEGHNLFIDTLEEKSVIPFLENHLLNLQLKTEFGLNPTEFISWEMIQMGDNY
jgi:hypothetical protein